MTLKRSQGTQTPASIPKEIKILRLKTAIGLSSHSIIQPSRNSVRRLIPPQGSIRRRRENQEPHITTAVALANEQKASKVSKYF